MSIETAMIPNCVKLEQNGTCSLRALGAASSDDGKAVKIDFYDKQGQLFPIAMSAQDLCDLLQVVAYMSQEMADKEKAKGEEPQVRILCGRSGSDLPPLRLRLAWSPENQKTTIIIGTAGLQFPMDADTAKSIGQDLVDKATPHAKGQQETKH